MQITLTGVTFSYPDSANNVLENINAIFSPGWTGVIGNNGCGKSTVARIAARMLRPDSGAVSPSEFVASYCEQDSAFAPANLEEFACDWGSEAVRLRKSLEIDEDWLWRYDTLSSGQQKRVQVAVALWEAPDLLVMDEPTNHLDVRSKEAIAQVLEGFAGLGILISHDRELLDRIAKRCLCFEGGVAVMRPGGYTECMAQFRQQVRTRKRERANAKREVSRLQAEATRRRNEASKSDAKRSARHIDAKDHDAKGRIGLAIVTGKDGVAGKLSAGMDRRLSEAHKSLESVRVDKEYSGQIWVDTQPCPRKVLARLEASTVRFDGGELNIPEVVVGNTDRIGVMGPNGSGKTTLISRLMECVPDDIEALYIPQEIPFDCAQEALRKLDEVSRAERGHILSIVAQLNSDPECFSEGSQVSPGEIRKLLLAQGIVRSPVLIVMDEPTNHLDVGSVEALERLLAAYPGAVVLVSHDMRFLDATTDIRWSL